jgi:hypothetical protein
MLTKMNLSDEEIRALNYERFYNPCPKIRKKMFAVYLYRQKRGLYLFFCRHTLRI